MPNHSPSITNNINNVGLFKKGLKIVHLNVCHLSNKFDELKCTLLNNKPCIDICAFSETFLNSNTDDSFLNVDGYNIYRKDRSGKVGGGIIVYILAKWNARRRYDIESNSTETIWLEISFIKSKPLLLGIVYRPPSATISWFDDFSIELEKASSFNYDIIITGDFNIDVTSCLSSNTKYLKNIMDINNLTQMVNDCHKSVSVWGSGCCSSSVFWFSIVVQRHVIER